jgi:hypothetical protein
MKNINSYFIGGALGALAAVVVAFSTHWVVTTSKMEKELADSRIDLLAGICLMDAKKDLQAQNPVPDLTGWAQSDARAKLANEYAPILPGETAPAKEVVSRCADEIQDAQLHHG